MRTKYTKAILFFILLGWEAMGQSTNQNYISTEKVLVLGQALESSIDGLGITSKRTHVEYFDGLGRPVQSNDYKASPDGNKDIITSTWYDSYGRKEKSYLPFASTQNMGYHTSATAVGNFSIYGTVDDDYAFSQTIFEPSPLNRVSRQAAPGYSWRKDSGHEVKSDYGTNIAGEVKYFYVNSSGSLIKGTDYSAATLYKYTSWDENNLTSSSTRTVEFKDKLERLILKVSYNGSIAHPTYYVYDDFGLLRFVLPPKAADDGSVTSTELDQLCYQYKYDERNRLIEKKLPGAGWEYLIYDLKDRLVLSQDAKLRAVNSSQYHYTLYDVLNRPIEQGICTDGSGYSSLRATIKASAGYTPGTREALIYTYYDKNSTTTASWGYPYTTVYSQHSQVDNVKGLVTGVKVKVLGTSTWLSTVNYYDKYGRLLQQYQTNPELGYNRVSYAYNFEGLNTDKQTLHKKLSASTGITLYENFTYDHMGRLTASKFGYNTTTLTTLATHTYDDLGRLITKQQHNGLQYTDYAYNARGWLTKINNPDVASTSSRLFAMQLFYDTDMTGTLTGVAQFNGNINGIKWRLHNSGSNQYKGYNYTYDGLNRLTQSDYGTCSGSTWTNINNYDLSSVGYDANGNITSLNCKNSTGTDRENLAYTYSGGGNQLSSVSGTYNSVTGKNGSFTYDNNGNAISDGLRGVPTINYLRELNLPKQYYKNATNKVDYTYDASGQKWGKTATIGGTGTATLYYGPFIYEGGSLNKVLTPEGYYDLATNLCHYYLKDHLGNTRITFHYSDSTAVVDQEVEYYPFGSLFADNNLDKNTYLYNGKELNNEFFENYDYGARMYDPQLGRWHTPDPMAEAFSSRSPYCYGKNNPLRFIDPTGMTDQDIWGRDRSDENGMYIPPQDRKSKGDENGSIGSSLKNSFSVTNKIKDFFGWGLDPNNPEDREKLQKSTEHLEQALVAIETTNGIVMILVPGSSVAQLMADVESGKGTAALATIPFVILDAASFGTGSKANAGVNGFKSFAAFKRAYGSAGEGMAWHHIVEKNPTNILNFGPEAIHNIDNIIKLPNGKGSIHAKISGFYSSKPFFTNGKTIRQWISTKSYDEQLKFGIETLEKYTK